MPNESGHNSKRKRKAGKENAQSCTSNIDFSSMILESSSVSQICQSGNNTFKPRARNILRDISNGEFILESSNASQSQNVDQSHFLNTPISMRESISDISQKRGNVHKSCATNILNVGGSSPHLRIYGTTSQTRTRSVLHDNSNVIESSRSRLISEHQTSSSRDTSRLHSLWNNELNTSKTIRRLEHDFDGVHYGGSSNVYPSNNITTNEIGHISQMISTVTTTHCQNVGNPFIRRNGTTHETESVEKYPGYNDMGDPVWECSNCGAIFWFDERLNKLRKNIIDLEYSRCCMHGKIKLSIMKEPPQEYKKLLYGQSELSKNFLQHIRRYNNMFSFTSMGGKIDNSINDGRSAPNFKIHGENYHLIGSLLPTKYPTPMFAQLYIYDTENEIPNRLNAARKGDGSDNQLNGDVVSLIKKILDENNLLVRWFRYAGDRLRENPSTDMRLKLVSRRSSDGRVQNTPQASEVAALIVGDVEDLAGYRDIVVECRSGKLKRINELHVSYLPLQYTLIYTGGEDGFRDDIPHCQTTKTKERTKKNVTLREYFAYRLHERYNESPHLLFSRRLTQQFFVDAYTMVESYRLTYMRNHQKDFRCDSYSAVDDAVNRGDIDSSSVGKRVILPSSFTGGARYMIQNYHDAMGICRWAGYPNLFITFTCNPKWPEIVRFLNERGLSAQDRQDIITRVFHTKLDNLMREIRHGKLFGETTAAVYTIEWQNRGLPHAHILIWLKSNPENGDPDFVDKIISAELPNKDEDHVYYDAVSEFMIHGPCGTARRDSPCMSNNGCTKHFPKKFVERTTVDDDGYVIYRRRNNGSTVIKNGVELDNRYVVPHNRDLLIKYRAHINVEYCNRSRSIKYLFKYVHKGHDRVTAVFYKASDSENSEQFVDEIKQYYDCRYISAAEAVWRLLGYEIHFREPSISRLGFHLEKEQSIVWPEGSSLESVLNRASSTETMFTAWMIANSKYEKAREITYAEFPLYYVWDAKNKVWKQREKGVSFGRLFYVYPGSGELFYLRILLNVVRGCTSYADIRSYNGITYDTFRDACYARGLLDDDKEYIDVINEASFWGSEHMLRILFVNLLISDSMSRPEDVFEKSFTKLCADLQERYRRSTGRRDLTLTDDEINNLCLHEIEVLMQKRNRSLRQYPSMPFPQDNGLFIRGNQLIVDELAYDRQILQSDHDQYLAMLNNEQRIVYDMVMTAVNAKNGGVYFLYGYAGTGKTFVWKTLSAAIRRTSGIVLNVASSGIASLLLPGGRTAHSRFAIPLNATEDSTCNIKLGSPIAELIVKTDLIIWDETPMMNRHCFEALDRSMRDIMHAVNPQFQHQPYGGKVIVFGGDFRQILLVIPKGTRQDIVHATINSSPIWRNCKVLRLTKNMRLQNMSSSNDVDELIDFSNWLSAIGDGTLGGENDGETEIEIPDDLLITESDDFIRSIVDATYPSYHDHIGDASFLQGRAILAPTLDEVDKINQYMVDLHDSEERIYLSSDSISTTDRGINTFEQMHSIEFLNTIKCSGVPNHELRLKVGVPVMLLRNIDHTAGLCNGTRLVITKMDDYVVEGKILGGSNAGNLVYIPRMTLTPSDARLPFKFQRRQFPLILSFAMTINKSQGQSLTNVGIYLARKVFSHGQLYVAVSRATNRDGLKLLIVDDNGNLSNKTTNVVYKEVFENV